MDTSVAGWHPDPTGRHEYRYWDGASWTDDVADGGDASVDPLAATAAPGAPGDAPVDTAPADTAPNDSAPLDAAQAGTAPIDTAPTTPYQSPLAYGPQAADSWQGPSAGPVPPGDAASPAPPGPYDPYATGGLPPAPPPGAGPPTALLIGAVVLVVALVVGAAWVLVRDDDTSTGGSTSTTGQPTTTAQPSTTAEPGTTDDPTATTGGEPRTVAVFDLEVGDCVTGDTEMTGEVDSVTIIGCSRPHAFEVFHSHEITATTLPDDAGMTALVEAECLPAFRDFVGVSATASSLSVNYLSPSPDTWAGGDRELLCLVTDPVGDVSGSLAGANR